MQEETRKILMQVLTSIRTTRAGVERYGGGHYSKQDVVRLLNIQESSILTHFPDEKKEPVKQGGVEAELKPFCDMVRRIFKRRETTPWSDKELSAFRKIKEVRTSDMELVEWLYTKTNYQFKRKDALTFLNNWSGEIDRAQEYSQQSNERRARQNGN